MNQLVIGFRSQWRDYLETTKPKVVALMILTSVVGMLLASEGFPNIITLIVANVGIALVAGGGAAFNHLIDARIDRDMARTRARPVATGRLTEQQSLTFAATITLLGMMILVVFVNMLTAWLTLASLVGYAFVYTGYLKRATPQNIVVGGLAGAAPPLLGWTAVTGTLDAYPLLLVLMIFAWTPPHFWALAIFRVDDYKKVGIPMLPVTHGIEYTRLQIMLYSLILTAVTLFPVATGHNGLIYFISVTALNLRFIWWVLKMRGPEIKQIAYSTFRYSINYLMLLFVALLVDHYWTIGVFPLE